MGDFSVGWQSSEDSETEPSSAYIKCFDCDNEEYDSTMPLAIVLRQLLVSSGIRNESDLEKFLEVKPWEFM